MNQPTNPDETTYTAADLAEIRSPQRRTRWITPAAIATFGTLAISAGAVLALSGGDRDDTPTGGGIEIDDESAQTETDDESAQTETDDESAQTETDDGVTENGDGAEPVGPLTAPAPETSDDADPLSPPDPVSERTGGDDVGGDSHCSSFTPNAELPIAACDSGSFVETIQQALTNAGYDLDVDGYFGNVTDATVRTFQRTHGLSVDGFVGPDTWAELCPYSDHLCEPDGTDTARSTVPDGVTIGGVQQLILHDCVHYPFQNRDGVADAHVAGHQYLVEDPSTGIRRVVAVWAEDDVRSLVVSDLSEATVAQTRVEWGSSAVSGDVVLRGDTAQVSVNGSTDRPCDTVFMESADGFVAYGIIDVCSQGDVTVLTLNTFWADDFGHAFSEMNYRLDDGLSTAQLRLSGEYMTVTDARRDLGARAEYLSGSHTDGTSDWTFSVEIDQYPQGGHECVWGQVAD